MLVEPGASTVETSTSFLTMYMAPTVLNTRCWFNFGPLKAYYHYNIAIITGRKCVKILKMNFAMINFVLIMDMFAQSEGIICVLILMCVR